MKGRYQLATWAKFNRPDPMRDWDWENPSSINLYQYVRNNPVMSWDPTGYLWKELWNWANGRGWVTNEEIIEAENAMAEQAFQTANDPIEADFTESIVHNVNTPERYRVRADWTDYWFNAHNGDFIGESQVFDGAIAGGTPVDFLIPAGAATSVVTKIELRSVAKPSVRINLAKSLKGQWHHIATDKSIKSGFTATFKKIFAEAGMKLSDKANLVFLLDHAGRHSKGYHQYVLTKLETAMARVKGQSQAVKEQALRQQLQTLRVELVKNPHLPYTIGK